MLRNLSVAFLMAFFVSVPSVYAQSLDYMIQFTRNDCYAYQSPTSNLPPYTIVLKASFNQDSCFYDTTIWATFNCQGEALEHSNGDWNVSSREQKQCPVLSPEQQQQLAEQIQRDLSYLQLPPIKPDDNAATDNERLKPFLPGLPDSQPDFSVEMDPSEIENSVAVPEDAVKTLQEKAQQMTRAGKNRAGSPWALVGLFVKNQQSNFVMNIHLRVDLETPTVVAVVVKRPGNQNQSLFESEKEFILAMLDGFIQTDFVNVPVFLQTNSRLQKVHTLLRPALGEKLRLQ